ncbi:MAG TPA: hypothetical protein VGK19_04575 [Capsulimonadaceae bacterium]
MTHSNIEQVGRMDGSKGIPAWDAQDQAPLRAQILDAGHQTVGGYMRTFTNGDARLQRRFIDALEVRDSAQIRLDAATTAYDVALRYFELKHGFRPTVVRTINPGLDLLVLVVLFIGEVYLGYSTFSFLDLPGIGQLLLAIAVGFSFARAGHTLGRLLKDDCIRDNTAKTMIGTLIVVPIAAMLLIAYLREVFAASRVGAQNADAARLGLAIMVVNPVGVMLAFFAINALLVLLAVSQSMHQHDQVAMAATELRNATRWRNKSERRLRSAMTTRRKHAISYYGKAVALQASIDILSRAYEGANLGVRNIPGERQASTDPSRGKPLSFMTPLSLKYPDCWKDPDNHLKWDRP